MELVLPVIYNAYPYKSHNLYALSPFLNILPEKRTILSVYGFSLWDYIVKNIDDGRYIEFNVDEYYLCGAKSYGVRHFTHGNLIYGYCDNSKDKEDKKDEEDNKKVYLINYYDGKPYKLAVDYKSFKQAFENCEYEFIYIFEHYINQVEYKMNIERICTMFKCYLTSQGYNDIGLGVFAEPVNAVYGISLYDDFIKDYVSI